MGVTGARGSTEVATEDHGRPPTGKPLQGGQKGPNPAVIGNRGAIEGNVGVDSEENHLTVEVRGISQCA